MSDAARADEPPDGKPREGSVQGYEREVVRLDADAWVVDVVAEPEAAIATPAPAPAPSPALPPAPEPIARCRPAAIAGAVGADAPPEDGVDDRDAAATAQSRHLTVDAPTRVPPRAAFAVHVQFTLAARGAHCEPTRGFAVPEPGRWVSVDLSPSDHLEARSATTARVRVPPDADSDPIRFELVAAREGEAGVDVKAFADQQFLGAVHVRMTVQAGAQQGTRQRLGVPSTIMPGDAHALTLEIRLDERRENYEFQIRGDGYTEKPVRVPFADLDRAARGLQQQLNELARGTRYSDRAVQTILGNQGADLHARLPRAVQTRLAQSAGAAERLSIVLSDNDPVPWELVYLSDVAEPGFLSDRFLVTRWPYGAAPPIELGAGERCYVLPPDPPRAASSEIAQVESHVGSGRRLHTVDEVLHELAAHRAGLMHFAAHNVPQFGRPASSSIMLDQPFTQALVGRTLEGALAGCRPLVFVNACSSNTPTPTLADTGAEGWATRFLLVGAGAFVGTLWEIRDAAAARFADAFYAGVVAAKPLGTAFRDARAAIRSQGDPTWLAYTLYAHPSARYLGVDR